VWGSLWAGPPLLLLLHLSTRRGSVAAAAERWRLQPPPADGGKGVARKNKYQLRFPVAWTAVGGPPRAPPRITVPHVTERETEGEGETGGRAAGANRCHLK